MTNIDMEALRDEIVEAMPWYDESNPDYTELDAILARLVPAEDAQPAAPETELHALGRHIAETWNAMCCYEATTPVCPHGHSAAPETERLREALADYFGDHEPSPDALDRKVWEAWRRHRSRRHAMSIDVEALAQIIREVDGNHDLGAAALAEAILARLVPTDHPNDECPRDCWEDPRSCTCRCHDPAEDEDPNADNPDGWNVMGFEPRAPAEDGGQLREALLRVFDLAEDRPDIREVARTALATTPEPRTNDIIADLNERRRAARRRLAGF